MSYYRLCYFNDASPGCFDEFQALDDEAARREAERHVRRGRADLWCAERHVATIEAEPARRA